MNRAALAARMLTFRWKLALAGVLVTVILVSGITALSTISQYADAAVSASVRQGAANKEQAVVAGSTSDAQLMAASGFIGLQIGRALVWSPDSAGEADSLIVDGPVATYTTLEGSSVVEQGGLAISDALSHDLQMGLGDKVRIRVGGEWSDARITGIVADPADIGRRLVVSRGPVTHEPGSVWVGSARSEALGQLTGVDSGQTTGSLVSSRAVQRAADENSELHRLAVGLAAGLALLGGCLLSVLLIAARRLVRADERGLRAAGMSDRGIARVLRLSAGVPMAAGTVIGLTLGVAVPWVARTQAHHLGQLWIEPQAPTPAWVLLALAGVLVPSLVAWLLVVVRSRSLSAWVKPDLTIPHRAGQICAVAMIVALALVVAARVHMTPITVLAVGIPLAFMVVVSPGAVWWLAQRRRAVTTRLLWSRTGTPVLLVGLAASVLCGGFAWSAASRWHTAAVNLALPGSTMQPRDSLVASAVPQAATSLLRDRFDALGGREVQSWTLPDEHDAQQRVTTASAAACAAQDPSLDISASPPECFQTDSPVPINGVLIGESMTAGGEEMSVDPALNQRGKVAVVTYASARDAEPSVRIIDGVVDDPILGGLLPGMSVAAGSPAASRLGLTPSSVDVVAFLGVDRLTERERATFKAEVLRLAPTTLLSDSTSEPLGQRYDAIRLSMGVAALLMMGLFAAAITFLADFLAKVEWATAGLRGPTHLRRSAMFLIFGPAVCGAGGGLAFAWFSGVHINASFGWVWSWCLAALLVAVTPLLWPRGIGDRHS